MQRNLSIHPRPHGRLHQYSILLFRVHLSWVGFELTMLFIICTDCISSCKSNYHTITATTPFPSPRKEIGNHNAYLTVPLYRTSTSGVSLKKQPTVVIETKITCTVKNNSCILLRLRVTTFSLQQRHSNVLNRRKLLLNQKFLLYLINNIIWVNIWPSYCMRNVLSIFGNEAERCQYDCIYLMIYVYIWWYF